MEELKITKEKVLEAAEKCSQAKETLKTLFPECFEKEIDEIKPFKVTGSTQENGFIFIANGFAPVGLELKCFGLNNDYDWELTKNDGIQILIPRLK